MQPGDQGVAEEGGTQPEIAVESELVDGAAERRRVLDSRDDDNPGAVIPLDEVRLAMSVSERPQLVFISVGEELDADLLVSERHRGQVEDQSSSHRPIRLPICSRHHILRDLTPPSPSHSSANGRVGYGSIRHWWRIISRVMSRPCSLHTMSCWVQAKLASV